MICEPITYTDFDGVERTENFYFNLTEAEITEWSLSVEGGLQEYIDRIVKAKSQKELVELFKTVIEKAYGEKSYETVNDSPDAITFSWECDTTPVNVAGYKPTAHMEINSLKTDPAKLKALEDKLYGTENTTASLPTPDEVIELLKAAA